MTDRRKLDKEVTLVPKRKRGRPRKQHTRTNKMSEDELRFVLLFLDHCLGDAERGSAAAWRMLDSSGHLPEFVPQYEYWENIKKALKWLKFRAQCRLPYLIKQFPHELVESRPWPEC